MKFKLLISSLLLLVFTPAFGSLSDATGLVNRFDIETGGHLFEVTITANFDVKEVEFNKEQKQLTFHLVSGLENNLGEILIPQNLLRGNFTFYLNDQEHFPKVKTNEKIAFITLNFTGTGDNKVDVIATNYLEDLEEISEPEINNFTSTENDIQKEGGGCLIATVSFDSELAPQVQQLRELRDNTLLQTTSGSGFLSAFNSFYYSFSPQVADAARENLLIKETIKIGITPLLLSLSVLNNVNMDSEIEVITYGSSIILLNLGMYFVAPALIIMRLPWT